MAFKVSARMVLELGAELISSDAVALYELVKNSVDAGSPTVEVHAQVVLRKTFYDEALEALADKAPDIGAIRAGLIANLETSAPAAARRDFQDRLLKAENEAASFAKALAQAYHDLNWIEVRDRGHGMSGEELESIFLTIGTRSRRSEKVGDDGRFKDPRHTILGDKGVGRLSAMRLGDHMTVTTSRAGEASFNILDIDWTRFSHDSSALIDDIDIAPTKGTAKPDPDSQGTRILIRDLSGDWDVGVFRRMVEEQFKRIVDPFPTSRGAPGWRDPAELFDLRFNTLVFEIPEIPDWVLGQAHAVVTADYSYDADGAARLRGHIRYGLRERETPFELVEAELISLTDPIADRLIRTSVATLRGLGPFSVRFYWYNRRILKETTVDGGVKTRKAVLDEVNTWAGGLMVFRDHFRINPYGGQDDDWLELDKKALGAKGYKVNRSQIIGQILLSSRNFALVEQTNREGLAENPSKQVLVGMLRHILITEFRRFIERVDREKKVTDETTTDDLDKLIEQASSKVELKLLELRRIAPEHSADLEELQRLVVGLGRLVDQAKVMAQEYEDDRSKFVHLAGIGLMVEFILHEIGRATHSALRVMEEIDSSRLDRAEAASLRVLSGQLSTLIKRVDTLDPLSTSRRQTKEVFDLTELVEQVIDSRSQQLARHGVTLVLDRPSGPFRIKAVRGMVLQIIENLFENAVYWLKIEQRRVRGFEPTISIRLDPVAREMLFSDNGPGVAAARAAEIFEPFVTSKPPGQGRGLGLYISREMARYHDWELSLSTEQLNDEGRSATFVVEMGAAQ